MFIKGDQTYHKVVQEICIIKAEPCEKVLGLLLVVALALGLLLVVAFSSLYVCVVLAILQNRVILASLDQEAPHSSLDFFFFL